MPFVRPTLQELIDRIQSDLTTRLTLAGVVLRRSVVYVMARVQAAAAHLLHGHLEFLSKQLFPDTSEVEFLERHASIFGLSRLAATYAVGIITVSGTNGTDIPSGTVLQRADGISYTVNALVTIAGGVATPTVTAAAAGIDGNAAAGVVLTFASPVSGANATAPVGGGGLIGGTDTESDDALRARLLTRLAQPPHGGNAADYITWAKEVGGVTRAWVYGQEVGAGTVTVRFVRDNDGAGAAIIPDAGEIAAVQAYLDARRPVTATVFAAAPTADVLNFTIHVVPDTSATRAAVQAELADLLQRDSSPGSTTLLSQIRVAVGLAAGVTDFSITAPAADVTHLTGHMATMGAITWV
jgi:uncharacterized phage protein gp47/JayE